MVAWRWMSYVTTKSQDTNGSKQNKNNIVSVWNQGSTTLLPPASLTLLSSIPVCHSSFLHISVSLFIPVDSYLLCIHPSLDLSFINTALQVQKSVEIVARKGGGGGVVTWWLTRWANEGEREWKERVVKKRMREGCKRERGGGGWEEWSRMQ